RGVERAHSRSELAGNRRRRIGALAHRRDLLEAALRGVPAPRPHPSDGERAAADDTGVAESGRLNRETAAGMADGQRFTNRSTNLPAGALSLSIDQWTSIPTVRSDRRASSRYTC